MARSYSDPSYGSKKQLKSGIVTAGTRATAIVETMVPVAPITVVDWNMVNNTLGTGGSSQWVLAATSANGTAALGTIIFVGTHAAGATVAGAAVSGAAATVAAGGAINLYSVLSTAANLTVNANVEYQESFVESDS